MDLDAFEFVIDLGIKAGLAVRDVTDIVVGSIPGFAAGLPSYRAPLRANKKAAPKDGFSRCGERLSKGIHKQFFLSHLISGTPAASLD